MPVYFCFYFNIQLAAFAASITYTYDSLNRVTSVDYGNGFTAGYTYDEAGSRLTLVAQY